MKKNLKVWKFAIGCMVGGTMLFACNKEQPEKMSVQNNGSPTQAEQGIEDRIRSFKQRCKFYHENPQVKSGGLIALEEAVWNMESALNFTYSHSTIVCNESVIRTASIPLQSTSGDSVDYTMVSEGYYRLIDSLTAIYNATSLAGKKVVLMDVKKVDTLPTTCPSLKLTCVIGNETNGVISPQDDFGPTDYWYYGYLQGKCGPYFGTGMGSDAAKEIQKLQGPFQFPQVPDYHLYFTDVEELVIIGDVYLNPNDDIPGDNMYDYLMFHNQSNLPNYHDCLTPAEIIFYYTSTFYVLTDPSMARQHTNPPGKSFISVNIDGLFVQLLTYNAVTHLATAQYGNPHYSYDPCFPLSDPNAEI
jgi:hypothetical protein